MVVEVPLTRGLVTLIDDEDAEAVLAFKWYANKGNSGDYAMRLQTFKNAKPKMIILARWLMNADAYEPKVRVDHKNRDTLDNRRANLRIATVAQNRANGVARTGRFKGVDFRPSRGKWRARIAIDGRQYALGHFGTEEEAAHAYDVALLEAHGEFALLNLPELCKR